MQTKLPNISVIIPSYNQGKYLEATFKSLLLQAYEPLEIIVIDGGSTDNSVEIIKRYEQHLAYWVSEKDNGQSEAINKGFSKATGEIITWLNSDDCYEPGALHHIAGLFVLHPDTAIVHGKSVLFGNGRQEKIIGLDKDIVLYEYFPFMRFPQPSSFFRHNALQGILPVNQELHYAMDFELIVKMLLKGSGIKRTDAVLSRYRLHDTSKSNNHLAFLKDWTLVLARFFNSFEEGKTYTKILVDLKLLNAEAVGHFQTSLKFTTEELNTILMQHLNICYHTCYREFDKESCFRISRYLEKHYSSFYVSNNYSKYNRRLKFIPKFVFYLLRSA